jgi:hypothetical protein
MLEHHPATRENFGDLGRDERVRRELLAKDCNAIAATLVIAGAVWEHGQQAARIR